MDGLTPINSGNTNVPSNVPSGSVNNSTPNSNITPQDTLQSLNGSKPMSLLAFMNLVGTTSNTLQETLKINTQNNLASRVPFYLESAASGISAAEKFSTFLNYFSQANSHISTNDTNIATLTSSLSTFNSNVSSDQSMVNAMNSAIASYQNGSIDQATYNTYVANYNAYAAAQAARVQNANTAITAFNTSAATTNTEIDTLNSNIPPSGLPLTHQNTYSTKTPLPTIAAAPPVPTSTISYSVSQLHPATTVTPSQLTLTILSSSAIIAFEINSLLSVSITGILKNADKFTTYQIFYLGGKGLNLPAAYTLPANKISVNNPGTASGAGSSVSLALAGTTLSNPNVNDVLDHSIFISELVQIYTKQFASLNGNSSSNELSSSDKLSLSLNLSTSSLVSQIGLLSVSTAVRLLGGSGALASIDPRSSIAAVAISLGLISELKGAISSGVLRNSILDLLISQNPSLSDQDLQKLASGLIATIELKVLLLGVLNLASSLESPELAGQLLGNATNLSQTSFEDTLKASGNAQVLSSTLAQETNLSGEEAANVVNEAIAEGDVTAANLQSSLTAALINKGLSSDAANLAAANALKNYNLEISTKNLQQLQITKDTIKGTPLDSVGVNALLDANHGSLSGAELKDKIAADFVKSGQSENDANTNAGALLSTLNGTFTKVNQGDLSAALSAQVIQQGRGNIDRSQANSIAAELKEILFSGNDSVARLLRDQINTIKASGDAQINAELDKVIKKFTTPDMVTLGLSNILGNPATALLFMASGVIYTPDQSPSKPGSVNREKLASIDMPI